MPDSQPAAARRGALLEVVRLFLRLGLTAFGGPAAHVALMEEECVRRRGWLTRERFLDVLGASNLIPGPTSTELAMHIGLQRAGWPGLVAAGICFIVPAAMLVGLIAAVYVRAGGLPAFDTLLRAVKPVALVIVLQALVGLAPAAIRTLPLALLAAGSVVLARVGVNEVGVLLLAGGIHALGRGAPAAVSGGMLLAAGTVLGAAGASLQVGAAALFRYFLQAGSLIFGSGYVLLPILHGDLVRGRAWLTDTQLLDAIAVGQATPGPLFTTATFVGYVLGGATGAAAATLGMFLPAFVFAAASARLLDRMRRSQAARAFLDGVNAAAVALIAVVTLPLARDSIIDVPTFAIGLAAAVCIGLLRIGSAWVLAAAAAGGLLAGML